MAVPSNTKIRDQVKGDCLDTGDDMNRESP